MSISARKYRTHIQRLALGLFLLFIFPDAMLNAQQDTSIWIEWLSPGLIKAYPPAFASEKNLKGKVFKHSDLLTYAIQSCRESWPEENTPFKGPAGQS
ncbi:MAG: hypothetical protein IH599_10170, partial [Bacteroidales bacterium]|nr:hypothetical protein [Bacteroidales bacterium]